MTLNWELIAVEAAKLVTQLGGALFIAWLTVQWALQRYKSEKMWERKVLAIAELQSALWTMKRIADRRYDDAIQAIDLTFNMIERMAQEWSSAESRFRETAAIARLFLPQEAASAVDKLETVLRTYRANSNQDEWETYSFEIDNVIDYLKLNASRLIAT